MAKSRKMNVKKVAAGKYSIEKDGYTMYVEKQAKGWYWYSFDVESFAEFPLSTKADAMIFAINSLESNLKDLAEFE